MRKKCFGKVLELKTYSLTLSYGYRLCNKLCYKSCNKYGQKLKKVLQTVKILFNSMKVTILDHYNQLEQKDRAAWKEFRIELERVDKLTYFIRSVLKKPNKSLFDIPSVIRSLMIKYLGFTHENFDTNTMPELVDECQLAA